MIFARKPKHSSALYALYSAIVAQSRQPVFFAEWAVPDTLTGRFDMTSLHMALVLWRLRDADPANQQFAQDLFDLFFKDMDRALREMGVNDVAIPKRIEKMGELFYGLLGVIAKALDAHDDAALHAALVRNVFGGEDGPGAQKLTAYVRQEANRLAALPIQAIRHGELRAGEAV